MAIFTLPPSSPFLVDLANFVLQDIQNIAPLELANTHIFLPTRRACWALEQELFKAAGCKAIILPRITPVRDIAELPIDALDLLGEISAASTGSQKIVSQIARTMTLAKLVYDWKSKISKSLVSFNQSVDNHYYLQEFEDALTMRVSHAECIALAQILGTVLDQMTLERVPLNALESILPTDFLTQNELSLAFLNIIKEKWPQHLQEINAIDPIAAWNSAMDLMCDTFCKATHLKVIIAGSTGSTPATAQLLCTIARHPNGTVILPGLDTRMSKDSWHYVGQNLRGQQQQFAETHPQLHLKRILELLEIHQPDSVAILPNSANITSHLQTRTQILSHSLLPVETTNNWQELIKHYNKDDITQALAGVTLIEAAFEEEEANYIVQQVLNTLSIENVSLAIITPNRILARRITAILKTHNVHMEDTGGMPLAETEAGRVLRQILKVLENPLDITAFFALAYNCHVNFLGSQTLPAFMALERVLFRGVALTEPIEKWPKIIEQSKILWENWCNKIENAPYPTNAQKNLTADDWDLAKQVVSHITNILAPWKTLSSQKSNVKFSTCVETLKAIFSALTEECKEQDISFAAVYATLTASSDAETINYTLPLQAFPAAFEVVLQQSPSVVTHMKQQRVHILGALEARLQSYDSIILAGLNEGIWPPAANIDPWLNRNARQILKMPMPERRIALSAHDFVQFLGHEIVTITRSLREGGTPTLPSRFLQRLHAVIGNSHYEVLQMRGAKLLAEMRLKNACTLSTALQEPRPIIPVEIRPKALSVTRVETLIQNPYDIYAAYILNLSPFETLQASPNMKQKGTLIHAACEYLALNWVDDDEVNSNSLQKFFTQHTENLATREQYFWREQFTNLINLLLEFERSKRLDVKELFIEQKGKSPIELSKYLFYLNGRADRIEVQENGLTFIDFKTGNPPNKKYTQAGLYAQFPLLVHIAQSGGFDKKLLNIPLFSAKYIGFKHKMRSLNEIVPFGTGAEFEAEITKQIEGVKIALEKSLHPDFEYRVKPYRSIITLHSDYDHLSRIAEWSIILEDKEADSLES